MTTRQENRFTMYITLRDYLLTQTALTTGLPNFTALFTAFQGNITQIQTQRDIQEGDKTGVAVNKQQLKTSLVTLSVDMSNKLVAFAKNTNNAALEAEVKFNGSSLDRTADTILKDRAQLLYNRANANVSTLATYGITATTQTAYLAAINAYQASITKPRLTLNDRKQATAIIEANFKQADDTLEKLDSIMSIVALTQPNPYAGYQNARKVIELGGNTLSVKGQITDADKNGIGKVKVTILPANGTATALAKSSKEVKPVAQKQSTTKGGFQLKGLKDGSYTATFSKPGHVSQTVSFDVVGGEMTKLNVVLAKE